MTRTGPVRFPAVGMASPSPSPGSTAGPRGPSPCIGVCRMDERTGWCEGCFRTLDEIAAWGLLDAGERGVVWDQLDGRRAAAAAGSR